MKKIFKNKIFIFSGPSAVGKGTIQKMLVKKYPNKFAHLTILTTRKFSQNEIYRKNRRIVSEKDFLNKLKNKEIIAYNKFSENFYGIEKMEMEKLDKSRKPIIGEFEITGVSKIKKQYPQIISVFLSAMISDIKKRLLERGRDNREALNQRINVAKNDLKHKNLADYLIETKYGKAFETFQKIEKIINSELKK